MNIYLKLLTVVKCACKCLRLHSQSHKKFAGIFEELSGKGNIHKL